MQAGRESCIPQQRSLKVAGLTLNKIGNWPQRAAVCGRAVGLACFFF